MSKDDMVESEQDRGDPPQPPSLCCRLKGPAQRGERVATFFSLRLVCFLDRGEVCHNFSLYLPDTVKNYICPKGSVSNCPSL